MPMYDDEGRLVVSLGDINAVDVDIVDAGGYFVATEVESALQELGHLTALTVAEVDQLENIGLTTISAAQWDYLGALTTHPLGADGTAGRIPRLLRFVIKDGTNANTLKCETTQRWNGDMIAETDNIAKGVVTGDFSLSADGKDLKIEVTGLSGNCVAAFPNFYRKTMAGFYAGQAYAQINDILFSIFNDTGVAQDWTVIVDIPGEVNWNVLYFTDA